MRIWGKSCLSVGWGGYLQSLCSHPAVILQSAASGKARLAVASRRGEPTGAQQPRTVL